ncbi:MAG: hypothetical protein ACREPR_21155 [Brasilonema sp.]
MTPLKKLSLAAASALTFLALGSFGINPAQAALFKLSFSGDANGYVIYDTDTEAYSEEAQDLPSIQLYPEAVKEYKIDLGEYGVYQGTTANANIYFSRSGVDTSIPTSYEADVFGLEVLGSSQEESALLVDFYYQKDAFGGSFDLPTSVPSNGLIDVRTAIAGTYNESLFRGSVITKTQKIPESTSLSALLAVGAGFILLYRQRRQAQLKNCIPNLQ